MKLSQFPIKRGFVSIKEAAHFLGVSEKSVRRLLKRRMLSSSRAFRKILIPVHQLEQFYDNTKTCDPEQLGSYGI